MSARSLFKLVHRSNLIGITTKSSIPLIAATSTTILNKKLHTTSIRFRNFYDLLGLKQDATQSQIKAAYYEKAKDLHPDTGKSADPSAFHELSQAYEILGDINPRTEYDKSLRLNRMPGSSYFTGGTNFNSAESYEWSRRPRATNRQANSADGQSNKKQEPFSMSHIQYVYKTLNREGEPPPPFRPFEDHAYANSKFNRYEFGRHWDPERKCWVYTHKKPHERMKYERYMRSKFKDLNYIMGIFMFVVALSVMSSFVTFEQDIQDRPKRNHLDMYLLPEDVMQYKKPTE